MHRAVPPVDELLAGAHVVSLPMRLRFRGLEVREVLLLEGPAGWGEFSPFLEYEDDEAARWLGSAVEAAWTGWPPAVRDAVEVNATVPAVPPDAVRAVLERFPGCATAKVKVADPGQSLEDDVARVAKVRRVLGAEGRIRVDANGAWSLAEAQRAIDALAPYDLQYVEQPCRTVEELAALRSGGCPVLIAADESVRKADDPLRVAEAGAADVIVLKVAPMGGVLAARRVADRCGLPVVVSSALDSSVGISAGLALAGSLPELPYACGLATTGLLQADVGDLVVEGGCLPVRAFEPDHDRLTALAAPPDRQRWWRERLRRCADLL
jgi:O-succinylbenzoate synthase